jgi:hypothetical protein
MANDLNQFFSNLNDRTDSLRDKFGHWKDTGGVSRTSGENGTSPTSVAPGVSPGFTPNEFYNDPNHKDDEGKKKWEGDTIEKNLNQNSPDTNDLFNYDANWVEDKGPLPTRNYYEIFNDTSADFFRHGLHIDQKNKIKVEKDVLHTSDGSNASPQNPIGLDSFVESSYENSDPVMFGFEIIIHGATSPIFNGGVEDFISKFGYLKEVGSRKDIISNFKQQFFKFFKSDTPISSTGQDIPADRFYLSYYLKKVSGLENLVEANTSEKSKSFVDYRKDVIKLSFTEDVSLSIGSMAYLYKLLYWSRINGKGIIPQNLLRFDCDIVVTELRNFTRVKKALDGGNGVQILKENLSRYVYSLYECQMFFDKMPHDSEINMGEAPKVYDTMDMSFNYKYSTMRFEKWVPKYVDLNIDKLNGKPDPKYTGGGQYAYLSNDRLDPFEISSKETTDTNVDNNKITSKAPQPPVKILKSYYVSDETTSAGQDAQNPLNGKDKKEKTPLDIFKENSKKAAIHLAQNVERAVVNQINNAITVRARLLNDSIEKIRNSAGLGRMSDPKNVYDPQDARSRFFYDIHNGLRDFLGESLSGALGAIPKGR